MAEAGHEEASALSEEAQRFWLARTALRGYLTARSELHWRVRNLYNKTDAFTKAVEGLAGVGDFQSCADECAYSVARARGGDAFACLGLEHWKLLLQRASGIGCILWRSLESRVAHGRVVREAVYTSLASQAKTPCCGDLCAQLDRALLRDLGVHAKSFMAAGSAVLRAHPHSRSRA